MQEESSAPPGSEDASFDVPLDRLASGETALGERLFAIGHGEPPIPGARGLVVALDRDGRAVVIVSLASIRPDSAPAVADAVDRLGQLGARRLQTIANELPSQEAVEVQHARFFGIAPKEQRRLNRKQRVVLLVCEEPDPKTWEALLVELGSRLAGVYDVRGESWKPLEVPGELRGRPGQQSGGDLLLLAAAILGVALIVLAFTKPWDRGRSGTAERLAPIELLQSSISDIADGTPADATHTHWIGQRRLLRNSRGNLVAVWPTPDGLRIVEGRGTSWGPPVLLEDVRSSSVAAAIDRHDDLHLAFREGARVAYAVATKTASRWKLGPELRLEGAATSSVVAVAYDVRRRLAHVAWVNDTAEGQAPYWTAISAKPRGTPRAGRSLALAPAGREVPVLATVAADAAGRVTVSYRRGDSTLGWFSRSLGAGARASNWEAEQRLPIDAVIGAATIAYDSGGTAHLVLRDSSTFKLSYFKRRGASWSAEEVAVNADASDEIDFPSLSVARSGRIYLFFQTVPAQPSPQIRIVIRDPAGGWAGPYALAGDEQIPSGAMFPTALEAAGAHAVLLWTRGGVKPTVQAVRVAAL